MKEKECLFCTSCGSVEVEWYMGGQLGDIYRCRSCMHVGVAMRGGDGFVKEFRKQKTAITRSGGKDA